MNYYDSQTPLWVYTNKNGESKRLYFFEAGDRFGFEHEGKTYYRLNCSYWFGDWIETQDKSLWRTYGGQHRAIYIVQEELMTLIILTWM